MNCFCGNPNTSQLPVIEPIRIINQSTTPRENIIVLSNTCAGNMAEVDGIVIPYVCEVIPLLIGVTGWPPVRGPERILDYPSEGNHYVGF